MVPELAEAIAAGVVGATVLYLVGQPLWERQTPTETPWEPLDPEETPRGQALMALREIEFDRATGKLSDADFAVLHARYSARALALLSDTPSPEVPMGEDHIEALIASRAAAAATSPGARHCTRHGDLAGDDLQFCADCGLGLLTRDGRCVGCGGVVPPEGRFCPGCGRPVRAAEA